MSEFFFQLEYPKDYFEERMRLRLPLGDAPVRWPPSPDWAEPGYFVLGAWNIPFFDQLRLAVASVEDGLRRMNGEA